ncbi:MAG: DUF3667 domain-containing protein [Pseudomonadota bacterium]|nr:DUF3667 domain-containing protein [Pseudomonadota bacterium]
MKQLTSYEGLRCANCGAAMQGEFCHECGQSIHSVLKPIHHMLEETVETVLHIDGRIVHTLPPLLLKPGFLTLEYFAGRRVRYVAPFRLMFVLCLLSFFMVHLAIDQFAGEMSANGHPLISVDSRAIETAASPADVREALQEELDGLHSARATGMLPPNVLEQADVAERELRRKADHRLAELGAAPIPAASVAVNPPDTAKAAAATPDDATHGTIRRASSTVRIGWLPDAANARLTALDRHLQDNWRTFRQGDAAASAEAKQRMINGVFGTLPPAMFVLVPVFAALLGLFYVFRRRLYMEHLIVALHGHAFLFLCLLLFTLAGMLSTWLQPHAAWASHTLGWLQAALVLWIPVYLLLTQKRVYRQRWPMTLLKFWCIGWCYVWLLIFALLIAFLLGAAH